MASKGLFRMLEGLREAANASTTQVELTFRRKNFYQQNNNRKPTYPALVAFLLAQKWGSSLRLHGFLDHAKVRKGMFWVLYILLKALHKSR